MFAEPEFRAGALPTFLLSFLPFLSSSSHPSPSWREPSSKQCQAVEKLPVPSGCKGRTMCHLQLGEFGHRMEEAGPG